MQQKVVFILSIANNLADFIKLVESKNNFKKKCKALMFDKMSAAESDVFLYNSIVYYIIIVMFFCHWLRTTPRATMEIS